MKVSQLFYSAITVRFLNLLSALTTTCLLGVTGCSSLGTAGVQKATASYIDPEQESNVAQTKDVGYNWFY